VNLIADQTKLTLTKFNSDKDQFLYTVLKQYNPNHKFPCGLKGSIDERIRDCSYQLTSETEGFVLVTRSKDFKEVHKEISTGLLWSDRLASNMNHWRAEEACKVSLKVADISGVTWRLPTYDEYENADKKVIRNTLPNMNYLFWTSSRSVMTSRSAWMFDGEYGGAVMGDIFSSRHSVRCVANDI
jgi:hypothetical protein